MKASSSSMETEQVIILSSTGQFSILAGEAQDPNDNLKNQKSKDSRTMKDYWDSFITIQTQKLERLNQKKLEARITRSRSRASSMKTFDKEKN